MNSELVNVEDKLGDHLIRRRENLFDDRVMLTAKRDNCLEDIFSSNIACLFKKICQWKIAIPNRKPDLPLDSAQCTRQRTENDL